MPTAPAVLSPATRARILDAAETLFARQGFEATTIKQIGRVARRNPALIYYHFGSKDELYRAVLQRLVTGMIERGGAALDRTTSPPDAIRSLVAAQMEFVLGHPNAPRLLIREMIDHEARHAEAVLLEVSASLFARLCRVIELGQRSGAFHSGIEPRFAAISTIAQVVYFIVARPAIGLFFGEGRGVSEEMAREFGKHAGDFAVRALRCKEEI